MKPFAAALCVLVAACTPLPAPSDQVPDSRLPASEAPTGLGDTLSIPLGAERSADGGRIAVRFVSRISDSRCPADVTCVWEGDAAVRLQVRAGGEQRDTVLHTSESAAAGVPARSVQVGDYLVTLAGLLPYPGTYPGHAPEPTPTVLVSITRR